MLTVGPLGESATTTDLASALWVETQFVLEQGMLWIKHPDGMPSAHRF